MAEQKRRFKVVIDNKQYVIIGNASDAHIQAVTQLVNDQLAQIKSLATTLDDEQTAVLLAINTVSDQLRLQAKIEQLEKENEQLKQQLADQN
ncbi:cell division protein ZapA [Loigolactobacillus coryniformis]|jgi:cell division protein ZapA|uniref:Stimulator of FtsZ polymerization and component of cell-division Z-ring n=3 Tax=Loigolactobacillus coryniformis TaxID=1610 RepID=A0A0R1FFR3_9LACO|nr:cell division protein ZapA [Loigolactobacillus coryniformis]MDT3391622.1 cell division protein ZapA [Bacillota bacterium]OEH89560.1 cell division protein FtsZ [Loigolactobacillus coryniformis subsp. coryniformis]RRG05163.1 MAG: cell division protein ZapA [Lactobacillus sp.]ATO44215.1 cell division protein FtsZ [Loigolactobacillus coryniformis subsp. torquens DSM 20004 = KCTC 3535]ATO55880.1 cell division protein FtsZ [Loigolactobacillus coryniformis subsp. coryniformis KCTC 3167 = DSM 20001